MKEGEEQGEIGDLVLIPGRSGEQSRLLIHTRYVLFYILYCNNFDRKRPKGADLYILWNVATRRI